MYPQYGDMRSFEGTAAKSRIVTFIGLGDAIFDRNAYPVFRLPYRHIIPSLSGP